MQCTAPCFAWHKRASLSLWRLCLVKQEPAAVQNLVLVLYKICRWMDSGIQHFALTGMSEMSCVVLFIKESLLCGFSLGSISQGFRLHVLLCPVLYIGNGKKTQSRNSTVAEEQWQVLWSFMWSSRQLLHSLWCMLMQRGKESRAATDWTEIGVSLLFRYME